MHDLDHTIPIGMHGDGGAYSKQDSVLVISWNSIIKPSEKGGRTKRIVFTMIRKSDYTPETLNEMWRIFSWSVNSLLKREFPNTDYLNIASGGERAQWGIGWAL